MIDILRNDWVREPHQQHRKREYVDGGGGDEGDEGGDEGIDEVWWCGCPKVRWGETVVIRMDRMQMAIGQLPSIPSWPLFDVFFS